MTITYHTEHPAEPPRAVKPLEKPLPVGLANSVSPLLPCGNCNGAGHKLRKGFTVEDEDGTREYPSKWKICHDCKGIGYFDAPDLRAILNAIKGRKPATLRSKRPDNNRDYYVWRLARFHGGKDVTMPMTAELMIGCDPYRTILDEFARAIASNWFGSSNYGNARWMLAMYGSHDYKDIPRDLGMLPTYDSDKPLSELIETY